MILKREKEMMFFGLSAEEHSMRGVGLFLFIYLGATLVASILTPPVYWAVEWLHSVNPSETTTWLLGKRLDIFYRREYSGCNGHLGFLRPILNLKNPQ